MSCAVLSADPPSALIELDDAAVRRQREAEVAALGARRDEEENSDMLAESIGPLDARGGGFLDGVLDGVSPRIDTSPRPVGGTFS